MWEIVRYILENPAYCHYESIHEFVQAWEECSQILFWEKQALKIHWLTSWQFELTYTREELYWLSLLKDKSCFPYSYGIRCWKGYWNVESISVQILIHLCSRNRFVPHLWRLLLFESFWPRGKESDLRGNRHLTYSERNK